jgi:hypothetical protein
MKDDAQSLRELLQILLALYDAKVNERALACLEPGAVRASALGARSRIKAKRTHALLCGRCLDALWRPLEAGRFLEPARRRRRLFAFLHQPRRLLALAFILCV